MTAALFRARGADRRLGHFQRPSQLLERILARARPSARLVDGLGSRYEIAETNIKRFSVGSPIQAPLDALLLIREKYRLRPEDVTRVVVRFPQDVGGGASIVDAGRCPRQHPVHTRSGAPRRHGDLRGCPLLQAHGGPLRRRLREAGLKSSSTLRWTRKQPPVRQPST